MEKEKIPPPRFVSVGKFLFKKRGFLGGSFFLFALFWAEPRLSHIIVGLLITIFGEWIRWASVAYSGPTTRARSFVAPKLVREGPYSLVRNPIYWGNFFIGLGLLWMSGSFFPYLLFIFVPIFWIYYGIIILAEEDYLKERFKGEFLEYRKAVKRFLPSVPPQWKGGNANWKQGLRSERSTLIVILLWTLLVILLFVLQNQGYAIRSDTILTEGVHTAILHRVGSE